MSDKSDITKRIQDVNASLTTVNAELNKLIAAKRDVAGVDTSIKYKVSPKDYHLEGQKYFDLETAEKAILDNLKGDMNSKKDVVIEQLNTAISNKNATISSLDSSLTALFKELEYSND